MSCVIYNPNAGPRTMDGETDEEGHRTYSITYRVVGTLRDGPAAALQTAGLPLPGSHWIIGDDADVWAWFTSVRKAKPVATNKPNRFWDVTLSATTKPPKSGNDKRGDRQKCVDKNFDDPLLEPDAITGDFVNNVEEATKDRRGKAILTPSFEHLRGPQVEFDKSRAVIKFSQNRTSLDLETIGPMNDTLNDAPLYGFPKRCWKLKLGAWERKFHGTCVEYFSRNFSLELNVKTDDFGNVVSGWDRDLLAEGNKVLNGHWEETSGKWVLDPVVKIFGLTIQPDKYNASHYIRFKDRQGENAKVVLTKDGVPALVSVRGTNQLIAVAAVPANTDTEDSAFWCPLNSTTNTVWDQDAYYSRGDLVQYNGSVYLAVQDNGPPDMGDETPNTSDLWLHLTSFNNRGDWNDTTTYSLGDYVTDITVGKEHYVHVEYYDESNFLLLGIPTGY